MDKIAVTTPWAQLAGFPGPRGAMRVGPGVSVPVFAVHGKQNPTWVRIRPNNEGNPPHLTQLSTRRYREDSTQPRVTLIGQKSIKVGLLELKLRICLSLLPIMLG